MATPTLYDEEEVQAAPGHGEGQNVIRASLFNLIVLSQDPERATHCEALIRIITSKFPCRIIFVRTDPSQQADFVRTTSIAQPFSSGENRVLCDQITIEASHNQCAKIPFLILPYIQPDLPIYILLGHDPATDQIVLPQIQKYANRVIFDTETVDNFNRFSGHILDYLKISPNDIIDMNWTRTKAWRDVLAQAFNSSELLGQLAQSKMIQITYASIPNQKTQRQDIQAIYLQAWLAAKLKWNLLSIEKSEGGLRISYKYDHVSVTVSLVPKDTDILEPGAIFSFEVMTHGDYHFLIAHENDNKLVKVHASNPERCEMPYTLFLTNYQNGPSLVSEVLYHPPSEHYKSMLQILTHPLWANI